MRINWSIINKFRLISSRYVHIFVYVTYCLPLPTTANVIFGARDSAEFGCANPTVGKLSASRSAFLFWVGELVVQRAFRLHGIGKGGERNLISSGRGGSEGARA